MKCPILPAESWSAENPSSMAPADCLREECAWWEQVLKLCAIKELALELRYAQQRIADIAVKVHGGTK